MSVASRNIELKARCKDLAVARKAAISIGAQSVQVMTQIDTYFVVPHGRLKLREIDQQRAELIQYDRADSAQLRNSDYRVVTIAEPEKLKAALEQCLGLRGVVKKKRELLMYHNVRIHLDDVEHLGTFLEFEAVVSPQASEEMSMGHLRELQWAMEIDPADHLAHSYSDLLGI